MRNAARTVKVPKDRSRYISCPHCGGTLNALTAAKAKRKSPRRILMDGILAALEVGPATPAEIDDRMGFRSTERTATLCRVLERKNLIKKIDTIGDRPGRMTAPVGIYALVIAATDSASPTPDTQTIDRARPNQKDSKRGARS